jgi:AcrR family transcriptional regulator
MTNQTKRGRGRPSANSQGDTRTDILLAAIDLFGQRGFEGVSLNQIAQSAGIDIGLIRYYFGAKLDLWQAAVDHIASGLEEGSSTFLSPDGSSDTERLKRAIRWFVQTSAQWPQISRMIVFDGDDSGERGRYIAQKWVRPFYARMERLIEGAKAEGTLPHVSTRTIFFLLAHGSSFPMALPALTNRFPGGDITSQDSLDIHADAVIKLLFDSNTDDAGC